MKPLIISLTGLPFSGKSTLAKVLSEELSLPIVNYDNDVYAKHKHEVPAGTLPAKEFEMIETIAREYLAKKLIAGQSLIYDDLGLQKEDPEHIRQLASENGANYVLVFVDTPIEVIEERRSLNHQTNGREHIDSEKLHLDISLLEKPQPDEPAIVVTPSTSIEHIVAEIHSRRN